MQPQLEQHPTSGARGQTTASIDVDSTGIGFGSQEYSVEVTGDNGCVSSDNITITFQECAGVDEISGLQSVVLFPNPNDGVFTLKLKSSKRIKLDAQLLTASGTEQYNKKGIEVNGASEQVIEVKGLQAGVYYLTLSNKDGKLIRKVLIK